MDGKVGYNYPTELQGKVTGFSTNKSAARCEDLTWRDVEQLRALWPRKLVFKGILRAEDALQAVGLGADAVVVSNHCGRTVGSPHRMGLSSRLVALFPYH